MPLYYRGRRAAHTLSAAAAGAVAFRSLECLDQPEAWFHTELQALVVPLSSKPAGLLSAQRQVLFCPGHSVDQQGPVVMYGSVSAARTLSASAPGAAFIDYSRPAQFTNEGVQAIVRPALVRDRRAGHAPPAVSGDAPCVIKDESSLFASVMQALSVCQLEGRAAAQRGCRHYLLKSQMLHSPLEARQ